MTSTAEFEVRLLQEQHQVKRRLDEINTVILDHITYLDKKKVLEYYEKVKVIISQIEDDYQLVREHGVNPLTK